VVGEAGDWGMGWLWMWANTLSEERSRGGIVGRAWRKADKISRTF